VRLLKVAHGMGLLDVAVDGMGLLKTADRVGLLNAVD